MTFLHRHHPRHCVVVIARDICLFVRTFVCYARLLLKLLLQVIIGRVVVRGGGFVISRGILWWEASLFQVLHFKKSQSFCVIVNSAVLLQLGFVFVIPAVFATY